MQKIFKSVVCAALVGSAFCFAVEVSRPELESAQETVEFENYTGRHAATDTLAQIRAIGTILGTQAGTTAVYADGRYTLIHAIDTSRQNGLDADILILGANAGVDHIRNLRHIVSAYLIAAYNYNSQDAATLATFITVYNAVYRGQLAAFEQKYKPVVMRVLTAEAAGLAVSYRDWPGKTQIVIPLFEPANGGLSTVDTTVISDEQVINSLREEQDDRGIPVRESLADLKDREAGQAEERAQAAAEQAEAARERIQEEQQALKQEQNELAASLQEAAEARNNGAPDADAKQAAAEKQAADTNGQIQAVNDAQKEAAAAEQEAREQRELAERKQEEAQNDRAGIAQDRQQLTVYVLAVTNSASLVSKLVKVDGASGQVIAESSGIVIRGRTIFPAGDNYIALTGEGGASSPVQLSLISAGALAVIKTAAETAADNALLVSDGDNFYTVIQNSGGWVVAKYDAGLTLLGTSSAPVAPETALTITRAGLGAAGADGRVRLFSLAGLREIP